MNFDDVTDPADQELDAVFDVLSHHRRRFIVVHPADHVGFPPPTDLAMDATIRENETPIEELSNEKRQSIALSLHHTHLPKLVDGGAVESDTDQNLARPSSRTTQFRRIRSRVADGEKAGR